MQTKSKAELRDQLRRIDHKGYKAYKDLEGTYDFGSYTLAIDHVQGDPFAAPSRVRILYSNRGNIAPQYFESACRKTAAEDYLLRRLHKSLRAETGARHDSRSGYGRNGAGDDPRSGYGRNGAGDDPRSGFSGQTAREERRGGRNEIWKQYANRGRTGGSGANFRRPGGYEAGETDFDGTPENDYEGNGRGGRPGRAAGGSGKSGLVTACRTGQEILERTAMRITPEIIEARIEVGFPAYGRTIAAGELGKILFDFLPGAAENAFRMNRQMQRELDEVVKLADDQQYIRDALPRKGLVAFVADGSVLPRESGISQKPMKQAVVFQSPESLAVTLDLPHRGKVRGMGVRKGITVIAGGGFHGKSTLLKALERGVYNHIAGDGRELVITEQSAFKLRAEEGRCIHETDISMFIDHLPTGADTRRFSTENASGSTSQAANTIEALAGGSTVLLIDEDTSATNFMVRDGRMAQLVSDEKEPITPFIRKIRSLYQDLGVSTVLVVGSSGDYLSVADTVLQMDCYEAKDVTARAKELCGTLIEEKVQLPCGAEDIRNIAGKYGADDNPDSDGKKDAKRISVSVGITGADRVPESQGKNSADNSLAPAWKNNAKGIPAVPAEYHAGAAAVIQGDFWLKKTVRPRTIEKARVHGWDSLSLDKTEIDLRYLEQITDESQTAALAYLMQYILGRMADGKKTVSMLAGEAARKIEKEGILSVTPKSYGAGAAAAVRRQEILACLARYRGL